jgi:hypothetical protein
MKPILRALALAAATLGLAALGGCAGPGPIRTDTTGTVMPTTEQIQSSLKGHAFVVGKVSVELAKDASTYGHPLPNAAYEKLLRWELVKAFTNAHLGDGVNPAYKVNVVIRQMYFSDNVIGTASSMDTLSKVVTVEGRVITAIPFHTTIPAVFLAANNVCSPMQMRQQIPGQAAAIALLMKSLQEGRSLNDTNALLPSQYNHGGFGHYLMLPLWFIGSEKGQGAPTINQGLFGINILTPKQVRDITGLPLSECHYKGWDEQNLAK